MQLLMTIFHDMILLECNLSALHVPQPEQDNKTDPLAAPNRRAWLIASIGSYAYGRVVRGGARLLQVAF